MPKRKVIFANQYYYHVFNRSINKEPIFIRYKECQRALNTLVYYRFLNPRVRLSYFLAKGYETRKEILKSLSQHPQIVKILAFCLMPNHFHLILHQTEENGISKFVSQFQNSYTRYFNTKNERSGHVFQGQFKAVLIEDEKQLLHLTRYLHLNPYSSLVVKNLEDLENYPYSSLSEYLKISQNPDSFVTTELVLSFFSGPKAYKKFVYERADYQKSLEKIKHLLLE
ncbi:transposase [Candidatus Woesebacteria bacterium]|nr:transposase [Candidatus Woesebacteria bacterium]